MNHEKIIRRRIAPYEDAARKLGEEGEAFSVRAICERVWLAEDGAERRQSFYNRQRRYAEIYHKQSLKKRLYQIWENALPNAAGICIISYPAGSIVPQIGTRLDPVDRPLRHRRPRK